MDGSVRLEGAAEIMRALDRVDKKIQRNTTSRALRRGGDEIAKQAKANIRASKYAEGLYRLSRTRGSDLRVRLSNPGAGVRRVSIGVHKGKKRGDGAFWAHMFEFGTDPHVIKVNRKHGKKSLGDGVTFYGKSVRVAGITPIRFLTRATLNEGARARALRAMAAEMRRGLNLGA